jgi:hypothetical protein
MNILYRVKDLGSSFALIAQKLNLDPSNISNVVSGRRRSARIEAEIARILGKADWNDVVLEARSEVQKKPVKAVLEEMRRTREGREKAARDALGSAIAGREIDVIDRRRRGGMKLRRNQDALAIFNKILQADQFLASALERMPPSEVKSSVRSGWMLLGEVSDRFEKFVESVRRGA